MTKRILSLLLSICFALTAFLLIGCGEEPAETSKQSSETTVTTQNATDGTTASTATVKEGETTSATASQTKATEGSASTQATSQGSGTGKTLDELDGYSKHPDYMDVNFGGKTFCFAVQGWWTGGWDTYEVCAELTGNDNLIDEAIAKRTALIENLYNCKITQVRCDSYDNGPGSMIANDVSLGTCRYDFCMALWNNLSYANYYNICSLDVNLEEEWWNASEIEALSCRVDGKDYLYELSGMFNLISYDSSFGLLVNKSLYDQLYSTGKITTDIFQAVRDGKWTFDTFLEVAEAGTSDTNGDQTMSFDGGDIFGCTDDGNYIGLRAFYSSAGIRSVIKTDAGFYESISTENTDISAISDWIDKLIDFYASDTITVIKENQTVQCIANGQSLFNPQYLYRLHNTDDYVVYGVDYGDAKISIVPFPKYSESQEQYYTYVMERAYGLKVSKMISNPAAISQFIEVYGFHSAKIVYPEYIKCIKTQCLCDEEAGEMLDIIMESRFYDFGTFKGTGVTKFSLTTFVQSKKNNLSRSISKTVSITNTELAQYGDELKKY